MDCSAQRNFIAQLARDASQFGSVAPRLQRGLGNVVTGVVDQLSTSPLDFIHQLLQNADDKEYAGGVVPEMGFAIKASRGGYVHAWDNGIAMSNDQAEALVTFRSTKRGDTATIGEKGVGWHSVFRVSHEPYVFSGGFSFKLGSSGLESMLTPQWVESGDLPFRPKPGTNFFLPLRRDLNDSTLQDLASLREKFSPMTLLFLRKIRRVHIDSMRFSVELVGGVWDVRVGNAQKCERVAQQAIVIRSPLGTVPVPSDVRERDAQIILAFPLVPSGPQNLFAWLPVMVSGLRFLIHADFVTTLSREALLEDSWNTWLWQQLPSSLVAAIGELVASPDAPLHKSWLDLWPTSDLHIPELQAAIVAAESQLRERPVVATVAGLQPPTTCVLADATECAIVPGTELAQVGRFYPLHRADRVLERLGAEPFSPDLFRAYVAGMPESLQRRYDEEEDLFGRVVAYLQQHDLRDVACLPVATRQGPRLECPSGQLVALAAAQITVLAQMGLTVVRMHGRPVTRAWLEGAGLHPATPDAVVQAILEAGAESDPAVSALQVQYISEVWDQLSPSSREKLPGQLLVWTEPLVGEAVQIPLREAHTRDAQLMQLFSTPSGSRVPLPASVTFLTSAYDSLGAAALVKLGAWTTVRLEEHITQVPFDHRSHALVEQWMESDRLPSTAKTYKFHYWDLPKDLRKYFASATAAVKTAFLELVASRWDIYEPYRVLKLEHTWRSRRLCPHKENSCEKCCNSVEQHWASPPFVQHLRHMSVPTTLGSTPECWRQLDQTILLPSREMARLRGLHLPLPVLAADITSGSFLNACGVATEVTADILLRGLRQLREQSPSDELLRQVQAFYTLLEHVTSDEAFELTDDWPVLACDPCPTELERRALESTGSMKDRQIALQNEIRGSLRWFALRDVRWEGPASIVQGHFALLAHQRTPDARRVYTRFVADILRVPDVGPSDLIDLLDQLARQSPLTKEKAQTVVRIYEELALGMRTNSLDESLLDRLRRRLLTHRFEFISGQIFACDNPEELGLARQPDLHFLHFPHAVVAHPRFLAQLHVPLAKDVLRTTYVGQCGSLDRSATDAVRGRLEYFIRAALHLLVEARMLPAADWMHLCELLRVEAVKEVMVKLELGPAQIERRVRHAVDWGADRCAIIVSTENRWSRSSRGQRALTAGMADLLAKVCNTSAPSELIRVVGLILTTPREELRELAEDERWAPLPKAVLHSLGDQQGTSAPAALLEPLREPNDVEEDKEAQSCPKQALPPPPQEEPPLPPPEPQNETAHQITPSEWLCPEGASQATAESQKLPFKQEEAKATGALFSGSEETRQQDLEQAALEEAARLRVEAALARQDVAAARAALEDCPQPLNAEWATSVEERVRLLTKQAKLLAALREAITAAPNQGGADALKQAMRKAEDARIQFPALKEALAQARRCLQQLHRQRRRENALARLDTCRTAGANASELEDALLEAWEAGVDQDHADFKWGTMQLECARLNAACDAVELAVYNDPSAVSTVASALQVQLDRSRRLPEEERNRACLILQQVSRDQAIVHELSTALSCLDFMAVQQVLETARTVPLARGWVEYADRWMQQRDEWEVKRGTALAGLQAAADIGALGQALCAARECFSIDELTPWEQRYQEYSMAAERARAALLESCHIEMLRDAVMLIPPNILPASEEEQWRAKLQEWEVAVAQVEAEFERTHRDDAAALEEVYQAAVSSGAGPQTLESMQQIVQAAQAKQAVEDTARLHAAQRRGQLEQQSVTLYRYLNEVQDLSIESVESAVAFAHMVEDGRLLALADAQLTKLVKAEQCWRDAEESGLAVDWRVAAAACRGSRQALKGKDAEARARRAQEREQVEKQLAQGSVDGEAEAGTLLPALRRARELGVPEAQIAKARARVEQSGGGGKAKNSVMGTASDDEKDAAQSGRKRVRQQLLPGSYGVELLGRWERISPLGAEALSELGLLEKDAQLRWGSADLPLSVVTQPRACSAVEGDVLGKQARRVEKKLEEIAILEEKILEKQKLKQEEWHKVAHKALHVNELQRLQAKIAKNGGCEAGEDTTRFAEVWEALDMVRRNGDCDPFERHLLEGAPAEPRNGWSPPSLPRGGASGYTAERVGALGELYVFTWLRKLVSGFSFENWCSSRRTTHPEAPPAEPGLDQAGCDFRFFDRDGLFCQDRDVLVEVKAMRVQGDPDGVRSCDFTCHVSENELATMRRAGNSKDEYYVLLWVAVGSNLACRVVAVLRQPHELIPGLLTLQPKEYVMMLNRGGGPPGLTLEDDRMLSRGGGPPGLTLEDGMMLNRGAGPPGLTLEDDA